MQTLRNAHRLARFVLVWFVLSMGVAIASPLVKPQSMQLVCSASGSIKIIADGGDDGTPSRLNLLDCPLCAVVGAPPPAACHSEVGTMGLGYALPQPNLAPQQQQALAAFAARGPPESL